MKHKDFTLTIKSLNQKLNWYNIEFIESVLYIFTPQPLRPVGYCFHPWFLFLGGGKKFVRAVSQKLQGVGS